LGIARAKQFAARTFQEVFFGEACWEVGHRYECLNVRVFFNLMRLYHWIGKSCKCTGDAVMLARFGILFEKHPLKALYSRKTGSWGSVHGGILCNQRHKRDSE
jgi:hypothetical protein